MYKRQVYLFSPSQGIITKLMRKKPVYAEVGEAVETNNASVAMLPSGTA